MHGCQWLPSLLRGQQAAGGRAGAAAAALNSSAVPAGQLARCFMNVPGC